MRWLREQAAAEGARALAQIRALTAALAQAQCLGSLSSSIPMVGQEAARMLQQEPGWQVCMAMYCNQTLS